MGSVVAGEIDRAQVRLAELVAALSLGIDVGFGQPMEHVLRQCLIALRLAEGIGLDEEQRATVYYTALLINVGCHSDAHEQAKWFGDDIALKSVKYDHEPRSLRMAATGIRFLGSGHPPLHRFRLGLEFALSGHREVEGLRDCKSHGRETVSAACAVFERRSAGKSSSAMPTSTVTTCRPTDRVNQDHPSCGTPRAALPKRLTPLQTAAQRESEGTG